MKLDYYFGDGWKRLTYKGKDLYESVPYLVISIANGDDRAEVAIPLDELKEALDDVMD